MGIIRSIPDSFVSSVHALMDPILGTGKRKQRGGSKKHGSKSKKHGSKSKKHGSMRRKSFRRK